MSTRKKATRETRRKKGKLKLPNIDAIANPFNRALALVSAGYGLLQNSDDKSHWQGLEVLRLGMKALEKVSDQLDVADGLLVPLRSMYETNEEGPVELLP